jgi:hypothetical protein
MRATLTTPTNQTETDARVSDAAARMTTNGSLGLPLLSAADVCEMLRHQTNWPAAYCSRLARHGFIVPVPGRRATYTRASVMKYIEKLCDAANVSRRSRGRVK